MHEDYYSHYSHSQRYAIVIIVIDRTILIFLGVVTVIVRHIY